MTCDRFELVGVVADRLTKRGVWSEPDVWAGFRPSTEDEVEGAFKVVFWKRLVKADGKSKRVPDGEPDVAVIATKDLVEIYRLAREADPELPAMLIQNKARENLNVTRCLHNLRIGARRYFGIE